MHLEGGDPSVPRGDRCSNRLVALGTSVKLAVADPASLIAPAPTHEPAWVSGAVNCILSEIMIAFPPPALEAGTTIATTPSTSAASATFRR